MKLGIANRIVISDRDLAETEPSIRYSDIVTLFELGHDDMAHAWLNELEG